MNVLITGGSGFLGRNLIARLLNEEHAVFSFGRKKPEHPFPTFSQKNFHFIKGNLATGDGLEKIPWEKMECVIHLAAAGVKASTRAWNECLQVNVLGTERLLHAIKKYAQLHPQLFLAKTFYEKLVDGDEAFQKNPYIATKKTASELAELWSEDFAGPVIFGTLYHTFGPDDDPTNVLSYAAHHFKKNQVATFSSGNALGDWLYIDDTISGIMAALQTSSTPHTSAARISRWDIGSGKLTSIRELVEQLKAIAGRGPECAVFDPTLDRTTTFYREAARNLPPGFIPAFTLQQGLEKHYHSL